MNELRVPLKDVQALNQFNILLSVWLEILHDYILNFILLSKASITLTSTLVTF